MAKRITGLILLIVQIALILLLSGFDDFRHKSFLDVLKEKLDQV